MLYDSGYFNHEGVDAMAFDDFYPEGHQGGISFIMNGKRVATNGDIRFDETPGQVFNALNFILRCHPGLNTQSFASGVGTESATVGYGLNRADWSYIPGGVVSGTALIRPDFPELLVFPYLWQQVEYVLGGGSSHYMFLVLATMDLLQ